MYAIDPPCSQTVIHYCAANNFIEFIQDLIELGAAIDIADDKGKRSWLDKMHVLVLTLAPSLQATPHCT
jgi:hypothetical protein